MQRIALALLLTLLIAAKNRAGYSPPYDKVADEGKRNCILNGVPDYCAGAGGTTGSVGATGPTGADGAAGAAGATGPTGNFGGTLTSAEFFAVLSDEIGGGFVIGSSGPVLVAPTLGAALATTINATSIPTSKTLVVTTDKLSVLSATTSAELFGVLSDETGGGGVVAASGATMRNLTVTGSLLAAATTLNTTVIQNTATSGVALSVTAFGGTTAGIIGTGGPSGGTGITGVGTGSKPGIAGQGGPTGIGGVFVGGSTSGAALTATATAGNSVGGSFTGSGSSAGVQGTGGGSNGPGGSFSGNGIGLVGSGANAASIGVQGNGGGSGSGKGVQGNGTGVGYGVQGNGGNAAGPGVEGISTSATGWGVAATNTAGGIPIIVNGDDTAPVRPTIWVTPQNATPTGATGATNLVGGSFVTLEGRFRTQRALSGFAGTWAGYLDDDNTSITAGTTQTQAGATVCSTGFCKVTTGNSGDGVSLRTGGWAGCQLVDNISAVAAAVWPHNSDNDTIDGGSADASVTLRAYTSAWYCTGDGVAWTSFVQGYTPATSADLAGLLSNETGTGLAVFATTPVFSGNVSIAIPSTVTTAGTTATINWTNGNAQVFDAQGSSGNVTFTFSNPVAGASYVLKLIQGSSARSYTWPVTVLWADGTAPTITTTNDAIDLCTFFWDGTNYLANATTDHRL